MNDSEKERLIFEWLDKHPARHARDYGLLESYIFLFDCTGCPCSRLEKGYRKGLQTIKQVVIGLKDLRES